MSGHYAEVCARVPPSTPPLCATLHCLPRRHRWLLLRPYASPRMCLKTVIPLLSPQALSVYERMLSKGVEPMPATYNAAVCALARLGRLPSALSLLGNIAAKGVERGVTTYAALLAACEALGRCVFSVFARLQARRFWTLVPANAWPPGVQACQRLIFRPPTLLIEQSRISSIPHIITPRWDIALDLLQRMQEEGLKPTTTCFNAAIGACVNGV